MNFCSVVILVSWLACASAHADPEVDAASARYGAVATATRLPRPVHEQSADVTVLSRSELAASPSVTTDGLLRSLPSVATFRRSSSLSADPSSQGLNLRGVGPSGVSRTLVLLDGVPVNDPFAGSVYFRALPRLGLERIEVVPGGGSALYGSAALAGVVQLFSRPPEPTSADADLAYGSAHTVQAAARVASGGPRSAGAVEAELLRSDGFPVVAAAARGPIDGAAASRSGNLLARARVRVGRGLTLSPALSLFREELYGQTRTTEASAQLGILSLRAQALRPSGTAVEALLFVRGASFDQSRARVDATRSSESRAARQHVPAGDLGLSLSWASAAPPRAGGHRWLVGGDARQVLGHASERLFPAGSAADAPVLRDAGGRQTFAGVFVEDVWRATERLQLEGLVRADTYASYGGEAEVQLAGGERSRSRLPSGHALTLNPRLGLLLTPWRWLRVRASAYRAFRAPTLNELYRPFQVGSVITAANPRLEPELLTGAEGSLELMPLPALVLRATGFSNLLEHPVINTTLAEPLPDGATRRRANAGGARIRGAELALGVRVRKHWQAQLGYTLVDARVTRAGEQAAIAGKRLAQDPVHRASALLFFDDPRWLSASLQIRFVGRQYEDDLSTLAMRPFAVVDAFASYRVAGPVWLFAAVENLLDARYVVGRAGVDTVGTPLLARVGVRVRAPD
jgi:iron complex outermembrane recepter protein